MSDDQPPEEPQQGDVTAPGDVSIPESSRFAREVTNAYRHEPDDAEVDRAVARMLAAHPGPRRAIPRLRVRRVPSSPLRRYATRMAAVAAVVVLAAVLAITALGDSDAPETAGGRRYGVVFDLASDTDEVQDDLDEACRELQARFDEMISKLEVSDPELAARLGALFDSEFDRACNFQLSTWTGVPCEEATAGMIEHWGGSDAVAALPEKLQELLDHPCTANWASVDWDALFAEHHVVGGWAVGVSRTDG